MTERRIESSADAPGPAWEKRGNAAWLRCPACATWFPVSPAMFAAGAPECCCPGCLHHFPPGAARPWGP